MIRILVAFLASFAGYRLFRHRRLKTGRQYLEFLLNVNLPALSKFQHKLKKLCKRSWSISMTDRIAKLNSVARGWINYFSIGAMKGKMEKVDEHLRTVLRKVIWKLWKTTQKRAWDFANLV